MNFKQGKRWIAAILAVLGMAAAFSGCKDISQQQGAGNVTLELDKNLLPDVEIENKTVTFYYPGSQDTVDKDLNLTATIALLKEKYGVDIQFEFAPAQSYGTRLTGLVAGGNPPDLALERDNANLSFIRNKLVQPIGEYFDLDSKLWSEMKDYTASTSWNGNVLQMPLENTIDGTFVYSNKKLFDEAGLDYPSMYAERGEWTWDTMLELAQQLTVMGADGKPEVYGYNDYSAYSLTSSAGADLITQDENGQFIGNLESQIQADTMNFYYDLTARRYNVLLQERPDSAFPAGRVAMAADNHTKLQFFKDMLDDIDIAPIPAYPNSDTKYVFSKMLRSPFICAGAENVDGAVAFINCQRLVEDTGNTPENKMAFIKTYNSLPDTEEANAIVEKMATMYEEGYESVEPRATKTLYSGVSSYWNWTNNPTQPWSSFAASWKDVFQSKVDELNQLSKDCIPS